LTASAARPARQRYSPIPLNERDESFAACRTLASTAESTVIVTGSFPDDRFAGARVFCFMPRSVQRAAQRKQGKKR
jgi:hypothetical protein